MFPGIWLCSGRWWCHIVMKTQRNQNLGAIFSLFCGAMYFFSSMCLNYGKICAESTPAPSPRFSSTSLLHPLCVLTFSGGLCMPFFFLLYSHPPHTRSHSQISAAWCHMLSPASADHTVKKCVCTKCWEWWEESKMVLLGLHINALWCCFFYFIFLVGSSVPSESDRVAKWTCCDWAKWIRCKWSSHQRFSNIDLVLSSLDIFLFYFI